MPLTAKGNKIFEAMTSPESEGGYGKEKGEKVFYASANKGTIKGVHDDKVEGAIASANDEQGVDIHSYMDAVRRGDSQAVAKHFPPKK